MDSPVILQIALLGILLELITFAGKAALAAIAARNVINFALKRLGK